VNESTVYVSEELDEVICMFVARANGSLAITCHPQNRDKVLAALREIDWEQMR
jgi:hypothetical protein